MQNHLNSDDNGPRRNETKSDSRGRELPTLALEICRGKTQFPLRPIAGDRCLIGSGEKCDMRLGGPGIPLLHSLLYQDGTDIWLDVISLSPQLLVNGKPHSEGNVAPGDHIAIDGFEFIIRQTDSPEAAGLADPHQIVESGQADVEPPDVSELSALELVELIEQEEKLIEEFDSRREAGAEALLQTIRSRMDAIGHTVTNDPDLVDGEQPQIQDPTPTLSLNSIVDNEPELQSDPSMLHQIEAVLEELDLFSEALQKRSETLVKRESTFADATSALLDMQNKMAAQLETLTKRLAELPDEQRTQSRRIA